MIQKRAWRGALYSIHVCAEACKSSAIAVQNSREGDLADPVMLNHAYLDYPKTQCQISIFKITMIPSDQGFRTRRNVSTISQSDRRTSAKVDTVP